MLHGKVSVVEHAVEVSGFETDGPLFAVVPKWLPTYGTTDYSEQVQQQVSLFSTDSEGNERFLDEKNFAIHKAARSCRDGRNAPECQTMESVFKVSQIEMGLRANLSSDLHTDSVLHKEQNSLDSKSNSEGVLLRRHLGPLRLPQFVREHVIRQK